MAFPSITDTITGQSAATNATSYTPTLPAGSGGMLLAIIAADGGGILTTTSTGWKKLGQQSYNGSAVVGALFIKEASTGSDTLVVNNTATEQYSHIIFRISGSGLKVIAEASWNSSTNSDPPNLDVGASGDYLWIVARCGDSNIQATAAPTNYGTLLTANASGTAGASTAAASRTNAAASENPAVFTSASEQWVAFTICVGSGITTGAQRFGATTGTQSDDQAIRDTNLPDITSFTMSGFARVNANAAPTTTQPLGATGDPAWAYLTWNEGGATNQMSMGSFDGFNETQQFFTARPAVGDWFFWYLRCSGSGAGALQAGWCAVEAAAFSEQQSSTLVAGLTGPPSAFRWAKDYYNNYINADMYGLRLWNTALSDAELLSEAGSADAVKTAGLLIDAPMSSWIQSDADEDQSGNNYDLTLKGVLQAVAGPSFSAPPASTTYAYMVLIH